MALTLESFWRYASSTCQRTSSDRLPTRLSSKFWGGLRLASRRCSASYKFVCCGLLRAWCSLGLPIGVYGAATSRWQPLLWAARRRGVPIAIAGPQGIAGLAAPRRTLRERIGSARSFMDGAGLMRLSIADASLGSSTGSVDAFWERLQLRFTFGFKAEAPAGRGLWLEPRDARQWAA